MKNLQQKFKLYLALIIALAIITLSLIVYILLNITSIDLITSISTVLAVALTIVLLNVYGKFDFVKHQLILNNLLLHHNKPLKINKANLLENINSTLIEKLGYKLEGNSKDFTSFYKIADGLTKKRKHKTLFAVLVFKNNISFIDQKTTNAFETLERKLPKKEKYNQRVFIQLKESKNGFNEEAIEDANKIFFISGRGVNVIVINVLYHKSAKEIYYLSSDEVRIPYYLKRAYQEIESIIN